MKTIQVRKVLIKVTAMKRLFRTILFTAFITFLCMCYIYMRVDPFRQRKIDFNISGAQSIRVQLDELEEKIDEKQKVYDKLYEISVELSE